MTAVNDFAIKPIRLFLFRLFLALFLWGPGLLLVTIATSHAAKAEISAEECIAAAPLVETILEFRDMGLDYTTTIEFLLIGENPTPDELAALRFIVAVVYVAKESTKEEFLSMFLNGCLGDSKGILG